MIRGMVERLAERLHARRGDVEGWLRLVRSYMVLGDRDKARAAAGDARRALASDPRQAPPDRRARSKGLGHRRSAPKDPATVETTTVMTRKRRRLVLIGWRLGVLAVAVALVLSALRRFDRVLQLADRRGREACCARQPHPPRRPGQARTAWRAATIWQCALRSPTANRDVAVAYQGMLPDLFREGQGVVAEGALDGAGRFKADTVLAKHDETYMPKEVAEALKKSGHWKDSYGQRRRDAGREEGRK